MYYILYILFLLLLFLLLYNYNIIIFELILNRRIFPGLYLETNFNYICNCIDSFLVSL